MKTKNIKAYLQEIYDDRLGVEDIKSILEKVCVDYNFGFLHKYEFNEYGFQDVNVSIETDEGKYFVKLFSRDKTDKDVDSYVRLMIQVCKSKVSYPMLFRNPSGYMYSYNFNGVNLRLCVQQHIDGFNFHKSGLSPTLNDLKNIAKQASLINLIDYSRESFELDTWATLRFPEMYEVKKEALTKEENFLIEPLLFDFKKISLDVLPVCLVHGDIIRTNVVKDKEGKIWIIDFGAATYQPRIIELAVLAHDLFLDPKSAAKTKKLRRIMLAEYQKTIKLTPMEIKALPTLIKVTHAMYLMSAAFMDRTLKHGNAEILFWLNQSKHALKEIEFRKELDNY